MKELKVYNLEFPPYIKTLELCGYKFRRCEKYEEAFAGLQHKIHVSGSELPIRPNTGTHQLTAYVALPDNEVTCVLPWAKTNSLTKLQDALLFLSLFTGRNVFALNLGEEDYPLRPDSREHFWGGQFRLSARSEVRWRHIDTGKILSDEEMVGLKVYDYEQVDFGLEKTINEVMETILSDEWRKEYDTGYFFFTFRQALRQDSIDTAFLLCWTVWEHLFSLHNRKWLDNSSIEQTNGSKKISFILHKYFLINIDDFARANINRLVAARNRLAHFGSLSDKVAIEEMTMFIRLTEQIMSLVLSLELSNVLNSLDSLEKFLKKK